MRKIKKGRRGKYDQERRTTFIETVKGEKKCSNDTKKRRNHEGVAASSDMRKRRNKEGKTTRLLSHQK